MCRIRIYICFKLYVLTIGDRSCVDGLVRVLSWFVENPAGCWLWLRSVFVYFHLLVNWVAHHHNRFCLTVFGNHKGRLINYWQTNLIFENCNLINSDGGAIYIAPYLIMWTFCWRNSSSRFIAVRADFHHYLDNRNVDWNVWTLDPGSSITCIWSCL